MNNNYGNSFVMPLEEVSLEVGKFNAFAKSWWQKDGEMAMLHAMHPARMEFIVDSLEQFLGIPIKDCSALDIGCGGGLCSESLSRLCHKVTGIDAAQDLLETAKQHARMQELEIDYRLGSLAELSENLPKFDLVCALEVIEHVDDHAEFLRQAASCLKPGGLLLVSTINRTMKSKLLGIAVAEYLMGLLPVGTHDWKKFVKPTEIQKALEGHSTPVAISGMLPDVGLKNWRLLKHRTQVNYIMALRRER